MRPPSTEKGKDIGKRRLAILQQTHDSKNSPAQNMIIAARLILSPDSDLRNVAAHGGALDPSDVREAARLILSIGLKQHLAKVLNFLCERPDLPTSSTAIRTAVGGISSKLFKQSAGVLLEANLVEMVGTKYVARSSKAA